MTSSSAEIINVLPIFRLQCIIVSKERFWSYERVHWPIVDDDEWITKSKTTKEPINRWLFLIDIRLILVESYVIRVWMVVWGSTIDRAFRFSLAGYIKFRQNFSSIMYSMCSKGRSWFIALFERVQWTASTVQSRFAFQLNCLIVI